MASIITHPPHRLMLAIALLCAPLMLVGCSKSPVVVGGVMPVEISGRTFQLEIVADNDSRNVGLGGRKSLAPEEGMLFSFTDTKLRSFVMRDCHIDIDIIFLDSSGRITAMHHMPTEEPKRADETQNQYEVRLRKYTSRFNARFAIELVGGMLEELALENGQQIKLDTEYLESITK